MNPKRRRKIASQIQRIVSDLIMKEKIKDHRISKLISITDVEITDDLSYAYIYVSHLNEDPTKTEEAIEGFESAKGFIRSSIGKKLKIHHIPEPVFKADGSIKYGMKIEELLKGLQSDD